MGNFREFSWKVVQVSPAKSGEPGSIRMAVHRLTTGGGGGGAANYWAPLTRKRHSPPHPAHPQHTNPWAPRTRERHQQEHRPQRPTERSDPTQHAKGRPGDRPGPREGATTRRNVTRGGGGGANAGPEVHGGRGGRGSFRWGNCGRGRPRPPPLGNPEAYTASHTHRSAKAPSREAVEGGG